MDSFIYLRFIYLLKQRLVSATSLLALRARTTMPGLISYFTRDLNTENFVGVL